MPEDAMTRLLPVLAMTAVLCLVACSPAASTGTASVGPPEPALTTPPSAAPPSAAPASVAPASAAATDAGSGGGVCAPSSEPGTVQAAMTDKAFSPGTIQAKVGDVITWTNRDSVPHTATYKDDPECTTDLLAQGGSGGLMFSAAGTYAFFCKIHADMAGTIEVTS
jgi:plastocyanin